MSSSNVLQYEDNDNNQEFSSINQQQQQQHISSNNNQQYEENSYIDYDGQNIDYTFIPPNQNQSDSSSLLNLHSSFGLSEQFQDYTTTSPVYVDTTNFHYAMNSSNIDTTDLSSNSCDNLLANYLINSNPSHLLFDQNLHSLNNQNSITTNNNNSYENSSNNVNIENINDINDINDDFKLPPTEKLKEKSIHSINNNNNIQKSTVEPSQQKGSEFLQFKPHEIITPVYDSIEEKVSIGLTAKLSGNFFLSKPGPSLNKKDSIESNSPPPSLSNNNNNNNNVEGKDLSTLKSGAAATKTSEISTPHTKILASSSSSSSQEKQEEFNPEDSSNYELTFYRRNLFLITANVYNARRAKFVNIGGNKHRIISLKTALSVTGSDDTKQPKLLYTPPKAQSSAASVDNDGKKDSKPVKLEEQEPRVIQIPANPLMDENSIEWKRLQFRSATAHNGRKKLQNFFTISIKLIAELSNGNTVTLIKADSRPIIVRGRNPRFYQSRVNISISDGNNSRVSNHSSSQQQATRRASSTLSTQTKQEPVTTSSVSSVKDESLVNIVSPPSEPLKLPQSIVINQDTKKRKHDLESKPSNKRLRESSEEEELSISPPKIHNSDDDDNVDWDNNEEDDESNFLIETGGSGYEYIEPEPDYRTSPVDPVYVPHFVKHHRFQNSSSNIISGNTVVAAS